MLAVNCASHPGNMGCTILTGFNSCWLKGCNGVELPGNGPRYLSRIFFHPRYKSCLVSDLQWATPAGQYKSQQHILKDQDKLVLKCMFKYYNWRQHLSMQHIIGVTNISSKAYNTRRQSYTPVCGVTICRPRGTRPSSIGGSWGGNLLPPTLLPLEPSSGKGLPATPGAAVQRAGATWLVDSVFTHDTQHITATM